MMGVLYVSDGDGGVADPVVDHGVHGDRHGVLGQNLRQINHHRHFHPCDIILTSCGGTPKVIVRRSTFW